MNSFVCELLMFIKWCCGFPSLLRLPTTSSKIIQPHNGKIFKPNHRKVQNFLSKTRTWVCAALMSGVQSGALLLAKATRAQGGYQPHHQRSSNHTMVKFSNQITEKYKISLLKLEWAPLSFSQAQQERNEVPTTSSKIIQLHNGNFQTKSEKSTTFSE